MDIRNLKDASGAVFSPKVSADSVYLSGSTTTLTSKLSTMDNTISGKANSSSLATVATSGSYNDLSDKPSITGGSSLKTEGDNRSTNTSPNDYNNSLIFKGLKYTSTIGLSGPTYSYLVGLRGWSDSSGGNSWELAFNDYGLYSRDGGSSWNGWKQIWRYGDSITAPGFYVSSSRKVKENINPTKVNGEDMINSVSVVDFNYIDDETHAPKVGFIAEDTDPLFSTKERKAMDSANCIGILMKAVQELSMKVKNLTSELENLTSKIEGGVHGQIEVSP